MSRSRRKRLRSVRLRTVGSEQAVLVAFTSLATAVTTGLAAWLLLARQVLTKKDHEAVCEGKLAVVFEILKNIRTNQERMDKKLDRLLFNGGDRGKS